MEATQGVKFLDRYAPVKLLEGSQDVLKVDAEVTIAGENGKLYGPFRIAHVLTPSPNGTVTAVAYRVSASKATPIEKLKKDELISLLAQQQATALKAQEERDAKHAAEMEELKSMIRASAKK